MKKRVFFAIDLPNEVKDSFTEFFNNVSNIKEVKWERPEKLHLTLIFLGFVDEKKIEELTILLDRIIVEKQSFALTINPASFSAFPSLSNPRVLWLPIEGDVEKLKIVARALINVLKAKGFVFDKRFSLHLTLGRFRTWMKKDEKERIVKTIHDKLPQRPVTFAVSGITLFESKFTPKGSTYNVLAYEDFRN